MANSTAPGGYRPGGYDRPRVTPRPVIRTPPPPPPRGSSYGHRYNGYSGNRNTIGSGSIWDRVFNGNGGSNARARPTPRPTSNYYPGGKDVYRSHTSVDPKGNRVWTFSSS